MPLLITLILGLFILAGVLIIRLSSRHQVIEHLSISLAAGAMIALVVLDLVPEIIENYGLSNIWEPIVLVIAGVILLKGLDFLVPDHHLHDEHSHESMAHIGIMSAIAITLHNILEGMTVYNIAARDISAGLSLTLGVGLHNIPMGMLIYATLKHEKGIKKYIIMGITVLSTFFGGLLMSILTSLLTEGLMSVFVCITLGMVLFIIVFELIPSIVKEKNVFLSGLGVILGAAIVWIAELF